jgi:cell division septation protein DedD
VEHTRQYARDAAVVTVAPVQLGLQGTWYRVLVGAFASAAAAQAALEDLYDRGLLDRPQGTILRTPHALSVGGHPDEAGARQALATLREAAVPAYIVEARGGAVRILVGAFERPEQASFLDSLLTGRGFTATLVQRTGIVR